MVKYFLKKIFLMNCGIQHYLKLLLVLPNQHSRNIPSTKV
jgi:hypothetical protein